MSVIDTFVAEYEREYDYWDAAARAARNLLESELESSGLRAIVTSRAKSPLRLQQKLHKRHQRHQYTSHTAIRNDIPDLAGVRVALYFPGQISEAEQIVRATLEVKSDRRFPRSSGEGGGFGTPTRRFSGYGARHFRAHLPAGQLKPDQKRYASAPIEVQVASVLMHAWSEVEHDLVYKPLSGELSTAEYALLDQLNGLVLAGEIALEQLQEAGERRLGKNSSPFRDHYELGEFLRNSLASSGVGLTDSMLGRVDILFTYLFDQGAATPEAVRPYLAALEQDPEQRPVADQLADLMLAGDESRYRAYSRAATASRLGFSASHRPTKRLSDLGTDELALGEFVAAWILLETRVREVSRAEKKEIAPIGRLLQDLHRSGVLTQDQLGELQFLRELRNLVLHGRSLDISADGLKEAAETIRDLAEEIVSPTRRVAVQRGRTQRAHPDN